MKSRYNYIAVDLGAESGRVMLAWLSEDKLTLREIHRFPNGPVEEKGSLHWDLKKLFSEIIKGIKKAVEFESDIQSIGIDTWGVDFGLINKNGQLIENPYHYRDKRTNGMIEKACKILSKKDIYSNTGTQFMQFNTLYQLLAYKEQKAEMLAEARHLLFMPDLFAYYLTGEIFTEYTIASTAQIMNMNTAKWSEKIIDIFGIPKHIFPPMVSPGTQIGMLKADIAKQLNCSRIPVMAVGSHDTASAVAAVPAVNQDDWAYLSSGTWSLLGAEMEKAVINEHSFEMEFTNEGGVNNTIRLLKNIMGLWLVQQCKSQWNLEDADLDYPVLIEMAIKAEPFLALINPEYNDFLSPGNMPEKINAYLKKTGQPEIEDKGQLTRVILESLAFRYKQVLLMLEKLMNKDIKVVHIVGGGCQNTLLNQFTADATGKKVIAGPVEAAVLGNVIMQAIAFGQINSLSLGRKIISESFDSKQFLPENHAKWQILS